MAQFKKFILYWLPLLAWMVLIFSASADTNSFKHTSSLFVGLMQKAFPWMSMEIIERLHFLFRKGGHMTEFAVLALLFWRAIRQPHKDDNRPWQWDQAGLSLSLVFLYAATDEFHQVFVPGRTGMVSDIGIDVLGGTLGLFSLWILGFAFRRRRRI